MKLKSVIKEYRFRPTITDQKVYVPYHDTKAPELKMIDGILGLNKLKKFKIAYDDQNKNNMLRKDYLDRLMAPSYCKERLTRLITWRMKTNPHNIYKLQIAAPEREILQAK